MITAFILIDGNLSQLPQIASLIKKGDLLICADGAADFAYEQKLLPDAIVGDLDSISKNSLSYYRNMKIPFIQYPPNKDETDTELAIAYALKNNAEKLIFCGLLGDRVDHMLANIFHVSQIAQKRPCVFLEGNNSLYCVTDIITLTGQIGDEVSLIPLQGECAEIKTTGLLYPLKHETLPFGSTRGISNVFTKKTITITVTSGILLVNHRVKGRPSRHT